MNIILSLSKRFDLDIHTSWHERCFERSNIQLLFYVSIIGFRRTTCAQHCTNTPIAHRDRPGGHSCAAILIYEFCADGAKRFTVRPIGKNSMDFAPSAVSLWIIFLFSCRNIVIAGMGLAVSNANWLSRVAERVNQDARSCVCVSDTIEKRIFRPPAGIAAVAVPSQKQRRGTRTINTQRLTRCSTRLILIKIIRGLRKPVAKYADGVGRGWALVVRLAV